MKAYHELTIFETEGIFVAIEHYFHQSTFNGDLFVFKTWTEFSPPQTFYRSHENRRFLFAEVVTNPPKHRPVINRHFVMMTSPGKEFASEIMLILDHLNWHKYVERRAYRIIDNPFASDTPIPF